MSVSVKTVADPRVVTESGVEFNQYVGPLNWEHYKIPASGLSNTQITFANLVTLGTNRIYDSAFQIEYTIEIVFPLTDGQKTASSALTSIRFHPFPLHWVSDQVRVNINGAACMTRPQENLLQRMMYWRQHILDKSCNFCPHTKAPSIQDKPVIFREEHTSSATNVTSVSQAILNHQMKYGKNGSQNYGTPLPCVSCEFDNSEVTVGGSKKYNNTYRITFREPVLCSPFNQRLDKIYQSPLFNITSIDMVYQLNDLRAMLERADVTDILSTETFTTTNGYGPYEVQTINITSAQLCFNVASLPPGMNVPSILELPYYDNVCYVTNTGVDAGTSGDVVMTSGVYTLAQVPTAIYVFVGPNQLYRSTKSITTGQESGFCPIRDINITMGNNTQLLNTTSEFDRYQMALANGLEDVTWEEFTQPLITLPGVSDVRRLNYAENGAHGCKCILRLIPGVDLLIPDKRLVGGTDAEQMVFQVRLTADVTAIPSDMKPELALWLMFEYCGILRIAPVHADIDMLPLKSTPPIGEVQVPNDITVDKIGGGGEGTNPRGAGLFDVIRNGYRLVKRAWNSGIGKRLRGIADDVLDGEPATKTTKGGAIIGGSDFYS